MEKLEQAAGFEKKLHATKYRILTLESSCAGDLIMAAASDAKATLDEKNLNSVRAQI